MPVMYHGEGGCVAGGGATGGGMAAGGAMVGSGVGGASGAGMVAGGAGMVGGVPAGGVPAGGATMVAGGGAGVAGGSSGALACSSAICGAGAAGATSLSYVGTGHGDYIQETTYRYVGTGCGEFEVVQQKRSRLWMYIGAGIGLLVLILVIVLLLLPAPPTTTTTPGLPYDCNAGLEQGWSMSQKAWCCTNSGKGCTTTAPTTALPYDCAAGLANAVAGWSAAKKNYCCSKFQKGCEAAAKTCMLWGDPHIISFDQVGTDKNDALSFYGDGDFWLVKTSSVSIQARFEGTKYTEGLAATNQVLVGGAFLGGHKIEVGTQDSGIVTVDGQAVSFQSTYKAADGTFTVTYDAQGEVPDVVPEGNEKRIVHMTLPLGISVKVFQWNNYVDVEVTMKPQPGQDGVCGNFNGDHADDTTASIMERIGARIRPSENLLSGAAKIDFTPQMQKMMEAECAAETRAKAQSSCVTELGELAPTKNMVFSCMFDTCFGMNVRARSHAKTYA